MRKLFNSTRKIHETCSSLIILAFIFLVSCTDNDVKIKGSTYVVKYVDEYPNDTIFATRVATYGDAGFHWFC